MKLQALILSTSIVIGITTSVLSADMNVHVSKVIHQGCVYKKVPSVQKKRLICDDEIQQQGLDQNGGGASALASNGSDFNGGNGPQTDGKSGNTKGANNGYGNGTNDSPGGSGGKIDNNGNR